MIQKAAQQLLSDEIKLWLNEVMRQISGVKNVWLIGSRANGCENQGSDWDFLVICNKKFSEEIVGRVDLHRPDVDLLVSCNGTDFKSAWGKEKIITLNQVRWEFIDENSAKYIGSKWLKSDDCEHEDGPFDMSTLGEMILKEYFAFKVYGDY